jgi:hypothetical protein
MSSSQIYNNSAASTVAFKVERPGQPPHFILPGTSETIVSLDGTFTTVTLIPMSTLTTGGGGGPHEPL